MTGARRRLAEEYPDRHTLPYPKPVHPRPAAPRRRHAPEGSRPARPVTGARRRLAEEYPDRAVAWFAVGCYYLCVGQHESARRFFGKATALDAGFAPAWLGFGHAFAAQDESDQARPARRPAALRMAASVPTSALSLPGLRLGAEALARRPASLRSPPAGRARRALAHAGPAPARGGVRRHAAPGRGRIWRLGGSAADLNARHYPRV